MTEKRWALVLDEEQAKRWRVVSDMPLVKLPEDYPDAEPASPLPWMADAEDGSIESLSGGAVAHVQHHGSLNTVAAAGEPFSSRDLRAIMMRVHAYDPLRIELAAARAELAELREAMRRLREERDERIAKAARRLVEERTRGMLGAIEDRFDELRSHLDDEIGKMFPDADRWSHDDG